MKTICVIFILTVTFPVKLLSQFSPEHFVRNNACFGTGLEISSSSHNLTINEQNCNLLTKADYWKIQPQIKYHNATNDIIYAVAMVDPNPFYRDGVYHLQWLMVNVEANSLRDGSLVRSEDVATFVSPSCPVGSGEHIYQVLVYRQLSRINYVRRIYNYSRRKFELFDWLQKQPTTRFAGPLVGIQFRIDFNEGPPQEFTGGQYFGEGNTAGQFNGGQSGYGQSNYRGQSGYGGPSQGDPRYGYPPPAMSYSNERRYRHRTFGRQPRYEQDAESDGYPVDQFEGTQNNGQNQYTQTFDHNAQPFEQNQDAPENEK